MNKDEIRISVADPEGILLDSIVITRAEFLAACDNPIAARALLHTLQIGEG